MRRVPGAAAAPMSRTLAGGKEPKWARLTLAGEPESFGICGVDLIETGQPMPGRDRLPMQLRRQNRLLAADAAALVRGSG